MADKQASSNPLVTAKAADTSLNVQLHPLVLLTISDYITRRALRSQQGPVIGAIIGQQNGRSFTLEHAFECKLDAQDGNVVLDGEWFEERLEQYRDVHKAPALDLVAMFTLGPVEGPQEVHVPVLKQVQALTGMEGVMLLLFHSELVDQLQGGKLPISLYETVHEQEGDKLLMKFRELSYEVETGEAEMIGVDFVAKGGGNATAVTKQEAAQAAESSKKDKSSKGKGKAKEKEKDDETNGGEAAAAAAAASVLSPEDEELIASLTAKSNAIKMLNQRVNLIRSYLATLPQSYLTDASSSTPPPATTNHTLLRSVNSMLSRVPLLAPPSIAHPTDTVTSTTSDTTSTSPTPLPSTLERAGDKERQDVHLTSLLASLTRSVAEAQSMGAKFHIVQREKQQKDRGNAFGGGGGGAGRAGKGTGMGMGMSGFGEEGVLGEAGGF
ncbi:hypothetical protein LTR36_001721 [Oleoguttula mirabilis]|uniref:COP9 signalosome complex subunit 6 n=1 Tax=Oleoguttula mirabilis TaxID=1507867 RepID=A0AAV9JNG4_9PEZI|nr:hypothetical protein LTR36_001721 [Oleoguttula mirabilis]